MMQELDHTPFLGNLPIYVPSCLFHALGPTNDAGLPIFLPKTGLEPGGLKDTTLNY